MMNYKKWGREGTAASSEQNLEYEGSTDKNILIKSAVLYACNFHMREW